MTSHQGFGNDPAEAEVAAGQFRKDLYYRGAGLPGDALVLRDLLQLGQELAARASS